MMDVSVIIPVYNAESTLAQCLDSVLAQTASVEVLCVDDGSDDSSRSILESYANEHANLRVFQQNNLGPGPARNLALDQATGRFVAFMDADDLYPDPDALRSLVELADANECRVAGGYLRLFAESGDSEDDDRYTRGWISRNCYPRLGVIDFSEYQSPLGYQRYIFDREMLNENKIRFKPLRRFQDPPFCASALHAAGRMAVTDREVYLYRRGNHTIDWAGEGAIRAQHFLDGRLWMLKFAREHNYAKLFEMMYEDIDRALPPEVRAVDEVAKRYQIIEEFVASLNIKTIGIAFQDLSQGGIQRVVSIVVPMLVNNWYRVVLLTTYGRANDVYRLDVPTRRVVLGKGDIPEVRGARLIQAIKDHHIDVVIFHEYYSPKLVDDVAAVKLMRIPYIVHHHNKFSNFFRRLAGSLNEGNQYRLFVEAAALITLSTSDEWYFRALGANAHFLPNPLQDVPSNFVRNRVPKTILWMARFTAIKRPIDAIRIFEKVLAKHPDAKLVILGELVGPEAERAQELVAQDDRLKAAVSFEGFQADVWSYLSKASVFLTTSVFEGFLYTLAEASAAGVPTVGYELPYLEMAKSNDGFVQTPQHDTSAAAEAICRLFEDESAYEKASRTARATFERLHDVDQIAAYRRILSEVFEGRRSAEIPTDEHAMILRETALDACWGVVELKRRLDRECREKRKIKTQYDKNAKSMLILEMERDKLRSLAEKANNLVLEKKKVANRDKQLAIEKTKVANRDKWLAIEKTKVANRDKWLAIEKTKVANRDKWLAIERKKVADCEKQLAAMRAKVGGCGKHTDKELAKCKAQLQMKQKEIVSLANSTSYRVGKIVTWPARKLWRAFRDNRQIAAWLKRR